MHYTCLDWLVVNNHSAKQLRRIAHYFCPFFGTAQHNTLSDHQPSHKLTRPNPIGCGSAPAWKKKATRYEWLFCVEAEFKYYKIRG
jgi:hypothetical protein